MRCGLAVMVAICPYSSRGRTNILKRRIIVVCDGPYFVLCSVLSLMVLCFALDLICVMWLWKDNCWSNVIPRKLPDDLKGMGVL